MTTLQKQAIRRIKALASEMEIPYPAYDQALHCKPEHRLEMEKRDGERFKKSCGAVAEITELAAALLTEA